MEMTIPIENQEIPQTGLDSTMDDRRNVESRSRITGLELEYNGVKKEMLGQWDMPDEEGCYFNFQFYTSTLNPDGTMLKEGITAKPQAAIRNLPRGQRVFLRVRMIKNTWLGPWSRVMEKWVP